LLDEILARQVVTHHHDNTVPEPEWYPTGKYQSVSKSTMHDGAKFLYVMDDKFAFTLMGLRRFEFLEMTGL
jgi:hypothetical protein